MMSEKYFPTQDEVQRTTGYSEGLKLSGDGIFATLQGEGITAGKPSVFLRLQNCNLHCGQAGEGWRCDAWYTWDTQTKEYWQETRLADVETIGDEIKNAWQASFEDNDQTPNLVITGGEPLLQQNRLARLLHLLPDWTTEIETNGTVPPLEAFRDTQINCSPKLATSGNELRARRRERVLQRIATFPNYWFKFVITGEDDLQEVDEIVTKVNGGDYSRVLLMSQGVNAKELERGDDKLRIIAQRLGCGVTARNHIFWFGDTRAT